MSIVTSNVTLVKDLRAEGALKQMRDRTLGTKKFREWSGVAAKSLARRVAADFGRDAIKSSTFVLSPILRAGLALEHAFLQKFPHAQVHHIGLERDEETLVPKPYYPRKDFRTILPTWEVIIIDPMLATAGTAVFAIRAFEAVGAKKITLVNVLSSVPGIARIASEFPKVQIYTLSVDPELDANGYILPGLGDYGDRYYGTSKRV